MPYRLEAIVSKAQVPEERLAQFAAATRVKLDQDVWLIPLTKALLGELDQVSGIDQHKQIAEFESITPAIIWFAERLSMHGRVIYIEAEFFGGAGSQASVGWHNPELLFGPIKATGAINQALHWLGVVRRQRQDEFDSIGLGNHRTTEEWAVK